VWVQARDCGFNSFDKSTPAHSHKTKGTGETALGGAIALATVEPAAVRVF